METYYFDVDDGSSLVRDVVGTAWADIAAAQHEAIALLPELAKDMMLGLAGLEMSAVIRDAHGHALFRVRLSLQAEVLVTDADLGQHPIDSSAPMSRVELLDSLTR